MKKPKRIIVFILLLMLTFGNTTFAEITSEFQAADYEQAIAVLSGLGIIVGDTGGEFIADEPITRAEMAVAIAKILGFGNVGGLSKSAFTDVKSDDLVAGYINSVSNLGIIQGYDNSKFGPDDEVTYEQAVKMLVCALGYDMYAQSKGGYPMGYIATASNIGLTNKVIGVVGSPMNRGAAAQLIYNALDVDILKQMVYGEDATYKIVPHATLLSENLKIEKRTGQITGTSDTLLTGESALSEDEVIINTQIYKVGSTNARSLLGYSVTYYFRDETSIQEKTLLFVAPEKGKNNIMTINADDIIEYDLYGHKYTYLSDTEKERQTTISTEADVIYNGKPVISENNAILDAVFHPTTGNIVLLDSNGDNSYDVLFITTYDNLVIDRVDLEDYTVYDKYTQGKKLILSQDDTDMKMNLFNIGGGNVEFNEIKEWDVLSVSASLDGKLLKVIRCDDTIKGKISEKDDDNHEVTIGGETYKVALNYLSFKDRKMEVGDQGIFYFDAEGHISAMNFDASNNSEYAYLVRAKTTADLNRKTEFKIFDSYGEMLILKGSKKIETDGERINTEDAAARLTESQLIKYRLDNKGDICWIDSVDGISGQDSLYESYPNTTGAALKYIYNSKTFEGKIGLGADTVIFFIPNDLTQEDEFQIKRPGYFKNSYSYVIKEYKSKQDRVAAEAIVLRGESGGREIDANTPITLVSKIKTVIGDDGNPVEQMEGYENGKQVELLTTGSDLLKNKGVEPGDIIRIALNAIGDISDVILVYDESKNLFNESTNPSGSYDIQYRVILGNIYSKEKNAVLVTTKDPSDSQANITQNDLEFHQSDRYKINIYDREKKKASIATADDLYDYIHTGNNFSKVLIYSRYGDPMSMVIFK